MNTVFPYNFFRVRYISILLSCFLTVTTSLSVQAQNKYKVHGEYGLWITENSGMVKVNWLTGKEETTQLLVSREDGKKLEYTSESAKTHSFEFASDGSKSFTLYISSENGDSTITVIDLEPMRPDVIIEDVDSLYVVGDIHGDFEGLIKLLTAAQLIDEQMKWTGGRNHFVALGDIFDKGYDVTRCLWFLHDLENQAKDAGGRVHVVLGNHEIMAMGDDLRYVAGKERVIANMHKVEYAEMFAPGASVLGRWLGSKPGIIKIDDLLLAHAGIPKAYAEYGIQAFNDSLYKYLHESVFQHLLEDSLARTMIDTVSYKRILYFFHGEDSVFWFRGYAEQTTPFPDVGYVLGKYKAKKHIIAHTPGDSIRSIYHGKIITVDLKNHLGEMLLMVKDNKSYQRFRITKEGERESFY